jgi:hypothetical protein
MSDGLITQPIGDLGDSANLAFRRIPIQLIAQLHVNIAVPNP